MTTWMRKMGALGVQAALLGGVVLGCLAVHAAGKGLSAPPQAGPSRFGVGGEHGEGDVLLHVILALLFILVFARLVGWIFRRFRQPAVVGEIVAGVLLGPSFLGLMAPGAYSYLLPPAVAPFLSVIAQVGIILYMFLIGIEFDAASLRNRTFAALLVSNASVGTPFLLGSALALVLYPHLSTSDVPFPIFALFMGVSMSVTAFPVLARILWARSLQTTRLGVMALACAAANDAIAWCLLALLVGLVEARFESALLTLVLTVLFFAAMLLVVRPVAVRLVKRQEPRGLTRGAITAFGVGLLVSALVGEYIGIHAVFGAFLLGTIIPHDSPLSRELRQKMEDFVLVFLLPAYFAFTGMRTEIALMSGLGDWLLCGLIILVASAGKLGGSLLAARWTGSAWHEALSLGILMNTRGLMELVVLNIALDLGVVSPTLFTMLVLMALATTLATSPLLDWASSWIGSGDTKRACDPPPGGGGEED